MERRMLVINGSRTSVAVATAGGFFGKAVGLLFRKAAKEGLLLTECGSIHTWFMRFAIDVVLLDREYRVLAVRDRVRPWRIVLPVKGARHVLELAAGSAAASGIVAGDVLSFESAALQYRH